ncbi:MAG: hypothetical protein Q8916_02245 [Bacteroidota bacterium]|nr:hypothetical protein [Bacteroidota bacterium]MDP4229207.1 hypothetical protein [Bacteroidota bacterium]MDP4235261.1 hypothetical protein [Bacteroidota bacterium]
MKYLSYLIIAVVIVTIDSCSPKADSIEATSMIHTRTSIADTNIYDYDLTCGCDFELKVVDGDTAKNLIYDVGNIAVPASHHIIRVYPKAGLAPGTYTGWLAIVTLKPDTQEDFRDTLRDTIAVR